jgi:hypothetical protein
MKTDTARLEQGGSSGSSRTRRRQGNSDKSPRNSRKNSKPGPAEDGGPTADTKLTSLDVLLTMLLSQLGEINDFGGGVKLYHDHLDLIIRLPNAGICDNHKMMHAGQQCPMC